jgi:hypothetical protein
LAKKRGVWNFEKKWYNEKFCHRHFSLKNIIFSQKSPKASPFNDFLSSNGHPHSLQVFPTSKPFFRVKSDEKISGRRP